MHKSEQNNKNKTSIIINNSINMKDSLNSVQGASMNKNFKIINNNQRLRKQKHNIIYI